jgi:hypothetical protein
MTMQYRNFNANDVPAMADMQKRGLETCPDTGPLDPNFWYSPGFAGGKNIFIAENDTGQIMGYAAIMSSYYANSIEARVFWIDIRTDLEIDPDLAIKDALLEQVIGRGRRISSMAPRVSSI